MTARVLAIVWLVVTAVLFGGGVVAGSGHHYVIGQPFTQHFSAYVAAGSTFFIGSVIAAATASVLWMFGETASSSRE